MSASWTPRDALPTNSTAKWQTGNSITASSEAEAWKCVPASETSYSKPGYYYGLSDFYNNSKKDPFGRSGHSYIGARLTYLFDLKK